MKKILLSIILLLLLVSAFNNNYTIAFADQDLSFKSKSYCLMDANSGEIILKGNENKRLPIASMCKIMTMLICFDAINNGDLSLDTDVTVSKTASSMGGSQVFLEENGVYKASELIKSIAIASANDSCVAMAEQICGSENLFVEKMNAKVKELGLENTNFVNATGLPKEGQYSSALDVATMFKELIKNKDYFKFSTIWMDKIAHPQGRITEISNTNKLIKFYTSEAGHCLSTSAKRNGLRFISVIIGAPDSKTRFSEASNLLNYGFNNYESKQIINKNEILNEKVSVNLGKKDEIKVKYAEDFYKTTKKNEKIALETKLSIDTNLQAPIKENQKIGSVSIFENGIKIKEIDVLTAESVSKRGIYDIIFDVASDIPLLK